MNMLLCILHHTPALARPSPFLPRLHSPSQALLAHHSSQLGHGILSLLLGFINLLSFLALLRPLLSLLPFDDLSESTSVDLGVELTIWKRR